MDFGRLELVATWPVVLHPNDIVPFEINELALVDSLFLFLDRIFLKGSWTQYTYFCYEPVVNAPSCSCKVTDLASDFPGSRPIH